MEWQAVVFALQILLLATGWLLFQKARAELAASAAEAPVLNEVRALQRSIKQLLTEITETADQSSDQLEARCAEARELLAQLDRRIEAAAEAEARLALPKRGTGARRSGATGAARAVAAVAVAPQSALVAQEEETPSAPSGARDTRRQTIYALADAGKDSAAIARETGTSEGEVETLLGLRLQRP